MALRRYSGGLSDLLVIMAFIGQKDGTDLMARRPAAPSSPLPAQLTIDQMKVGITRLNRRIADLEAFDPNSVQQRFAPEVKALQTSIEESLSVVFGHGTIEYNRYRRAAYFDWGPLDATPDWIAVRSGGLDYPDYAQNFRAHVAKSKEDAISLLRQAVRGLEEEIGDREELAAAAINAAPAIISPAHNRKVFVVHGREEGPREAAARFLERPGFQPIILHEQANQGRTVIEKVENHSDVGICSDYPDSRRHG
jgi:hypothetical protein